MRLHTQNSTVRASRLKSDRARRNARLDTKAAGPRPLAKMKGEWSPEANEVFEMFVSKTIPSWLRL